MEVIISTILKLIIAVIIVVATTYVVPWLRNNVTDQELANIKTWVEIFVKAAEMLFPNNGEKQGDVKLDKVTEWINEVIKDTSVTLTEDQLRGIIESTVQELNDTKEEN